MSDLMKKIGGRIKHYRKAKGMTQKELGEKVGCHEGTIRQYENGLREPRMVSKLAIARALDVSYDRLFSLKDESATDRNVGTKLSTNLAEVGTDVPDINVGELISRQAAIEALEKWLHGLFGITEADGTATIFKTIRQLPPIQPVNCSEFPNNSDTISRQAAIDLLKQMRKDGDMIPWEGKDVFARIRKLPPAEPKRGRWEMGKDERFVECSECGLMTTRNELMGLAVFGKNEPNFCPNCGADMREVTT